MLSPNLRTTPVSQLLTDKQQADLRLLLAMLAENATAPGEPLCEQLLLCVGDAQHRSVNLTLRPATRRQAARLIGPKGRTINAVRQIVECWAAVWDGHITITVSVEQPKPKSKPKPSPAPSPSMEPEKR